MSSEKILAGLIAGGCLVAALGSWFGASAHKTEDASSTSSSLFDSANAPIARLDVSGAIVDGGGGGLGGGSTSAQAMLKELARVREDGCKVVLLKLDSPGGTASGSQEVHDELVRMKREQGIKVVADMGDLAASGAYYMAAAADEIVANPATITGSIGVIMHTTNWQGLMSKLGVTNGAIKSAPMKDIGSPDRAMTKAEHDLLQSMINDTYAQFLEAVSAGRKIPINQLKPLADGRVFTGRQALKLHLVDKLGNWRIAEEEARAIAKLPKDAKIKDYGQQDWQDTLTGLFSRTSISPLAQVLGPKEAMLQSGAFDKVPLMLYE